MGKLLEHEIEDSSLIQVKVKVIQVVCMITKAFIPGVKICKLYILKNHWEEAELMIEIVDFSQQDTILTIIGDISGVSSTTEVIPT
jgi:type III secretion protein N (ATPase)